MSLLLDDLVVLSGCDFISDLRFPPVRTGLRQVLQQIPADRYQAEDWAEALSYLTGDAPADKTPDQLRRLLLEQLSP